MLILSLDTSSPSGSVAVLRDDKVVGTVSTWTDELYSARMFRHIDFLLRDLSLRLEDFELFAVAAGPGSFTGLRVGLAAVKGWSEVYQKPIAAVSALEAVAAQSQSGAALLVPVLDARRGQVYFAFYRRQADATQENRLALEGAECVATPEEFATAVKARAADAGFAIVSPQPALIRSYVPALRTNEGTPAITPVEGASSILAPYIGRLGYWRAQRGELIDALTLDANYVRRSDAELHWKESPGS